MSRVEFQCFADARSREDWRPARQAVMIEDFAHELAIRDQGDQRSPRPAFATLEHGFSRSGLPIGLLISGPPFAAGRVLALAHALERATAWHRSRPTM